MTDKQIDFIISTLEEAIGWSEYTPEYFKAKHRLADDKEDVLEAIKILNNEKER